VHYYSFRINDHAAETGHLSLLEDAIYRRLIDLYFRTEKPLQDDVSELARVIRARGHENEIASILKEFFSLKKAGWFHVACDEQLGSFKAKSDKARHSAEQRWSKTDANAMRPHSERNATAMPTHSERNANAMLTNNQEPITINHKPITKNQEPITREAKEKKAPIGAASAEPPLHGSLTLEEAQEVIKKAHEKYPGLQRFKDERTGEPMTDLVFGAHLLWIRDKPRAIEVGITTAPGEVIKAAIKKPEEPKEPTKVKAERPADCDEQVWKDWLKARGRNALTDTAWGAMLSEASKAGITPAEAVKVCAERGWRGFRADWLTRDKVSRPGRREEVDIAAMWGRKPIYEREA
jgi:uncharacterized protein YdaU (DUF1376 family)